MAKLSKKAKTLATAIDREKLHGVDDALALGALVQQVAIGIARNDGAGHTSPVA